MTTSRQHFRNGVLLALVAVAMILTMAGYADTLIQGAGMGLVTDSNRDYLTDAFDRCLVGFLVLSGIKSGLAIIEGSEVGIGFNLEIGDIVQSVYDYVDVAWKTALAGGTVLLMTRFCLDAVALVDHWFLVLMLLSVGVYWVLAWYQPQIRRVNRLARESIIFPLTFFVILYLFTRNFIRFINRSAEPIPVGEYAQ